MRRFTIFILLGSLFPAQGAWAEDGPLCINFTAATSSACGAGRNDREIESGLVYNESGSPCGIRQTQFLTTDGAWHCLQTESAPPHAARVQGVPSQINDPDHDARSETLMNTLDTTLATQGTTRFELNITGHAGLRARPPDGVDLAINAFQAGDDDPSSFTSRDLLSRIERNHTPLGTRPLAMVFDTCFSGTAVEDFAHYVATTPDASNVCAIGATGDDEFAQVGASLAHLRHGLRDTLGCEPSLVELHRQAMRSTSMPSVPTLTSDSLLDEFQRAKAGGAAAADGSDVITAGLIREGISALPCSREDLLKSTPIPAVSGLNQDVAQVMSHLDEPYLQTRMTQMQSDAITLLRSAGIQGCGTLAADASNLDSTKSACFTQKLESAYATAVQQLNQARDRSLTDSERIKHHYEQRGELLDDLIDEWMGMPHYDRTYESVTRGDRQAIAAAFRQARDAVMARYRQTAQHNGDAQNFFERTHHTCGRDFDTIHTCIENAGASAPTDFSSCQDRRRAEYDRLAGAAGCPALSPHSATPSQPSPRAACEAQVQAKTLPDTFNCGVDPDCRTRFLHDSPCDVPLGTMQRDMREALRSFLAREHGSEASEVNAVYSREFRTARDTRAVRRAYQQIRNLANLRSLARDTTDTGRRFRGLYLQTVQCEGFDPNQGNGCIVTTSRAH